MKEANSKGTNQEVVGIKPKSAGVRQRQEAERYSLELRYEVLEHFLFDGWGNKGF